LEIAFPHLREAPYEITSPADPSYNCIAWAVGENERWWWPSSQAFWPQGVSLRPTLDAFVEAFSYQGYERCGDSSLEDGWEKVVIYAREDQRPTHVARQLTDGKWTSKLGKDVDISHANLDCICGNKYGKPVVIMRRRRERTGPSREESST
jgi:hypothetical protein